MSLTPSDLGTILLFSSLKADPKPLLHSATQKHPQDHGWRRAGAPGDGRGERKKDGREGQAEGDKASGTCPAYISPSGPLLIHHPRHPLLTSRGCKQAQGLFRGTPAERQQRRGESTVRWRPADSSPREPVWRSTPPSLCPTAQDRGSRRLGSPGVPDSLHRVKNALFRKSSTLLQLAGEGPQERWSYPRGFLLQAQSSTWALRDAHICREQLSPPTCTCGFSGPWTHRIEPQIPPPGVRCGGQREHPSSFFHL